MSGRKTAMNTQHTKKICLCVCVYVCVTHIHTWKAWLAPPWVKVMANINEAINSGQIKSSHSETEKWTNFQDFRVNSSIWKHALLSNIPDRLQPHWYHVRAETALSRPWMNSRSLHNEQHTAKHVSNVTALSPWLSNYVIRMLFSKSYNLYMMELLSEWSVWGFANNFS